MSIRAQLTALALLVALPLVALLAHQIYRQFTVDAAQAAESVQRVARAAAPDTRRTLDETERVLKRLAQHPLVTGGLTATRSRGSSTSGARQRP